MPSDAHDSGSRNGSDALFAQTADLQQFDRVVLIVDDHRDFRETLAEVLDDAGYRVGCAANGREALARLRQGPTPFLILLDLQMPVMNGWEFLRCRADEPTLARVPVIVISACADDPGTRSSLSDCQLLKKPIDLPALLELVAAHCSNCT